MRNKIFALLVASLFLCAPSRAQMGDYESLGQEQAAEKSELQKMKDELRGIKSEINEGMQGLNDLARQHEASPSFKEVHLFVKDGTWEISPEVSIAALTYNGRIPGPTISAFEGEPVKIVVHNQMKTPTSLYFDGMTLPASVDGLPRKGQGLIMPGEVYAYQFAAKPQGTYWYHPQVVHGTQRLAGLYGALVVVTKSANKTYEHEEALIFGETTVQKPRPGAAPYMVTYYTVNGKSAPAVPPLEVRQGERVRLRLINASQHSIPLQLTGHRFEVVGMNGGDPLEPHVFRDTVNLNVGERVDVEFVADNPGVWSLNSQLLDQSTSEGKFPGGIAMVVRYKSAAPAAE